MPPARIRAARSVAGRPRAWGAAGADVGLEEQGHGLLDGGDGVGDGVGGAVQRAGEQAVPEPGGVRVLAQDFGGLFGGDGVGDPFQDVLDAAAGQRGGVQEALQHLGGFGGVEAGGVVGAAVGDGAGDGAGGERLRAAFGDLGVDAPGDGVPHQLGQVPGGGAERVEDRDRPFGVAPGRGCWRRATVSSRSSSLVRVTSAGPSWASRAGASRSRVLPEPCAPNTPVVRS